VNRKEDAVGGAIAAELKDALHSRRRCEIEIRAPLGAESRKTAERLLKGFSLSGFEGKIIDVVASPSSGILVECSHDTSQIALSIQTAFTTAGLHAELLIHDRGRAKTIILHLGEEPPAR